MIRPAGPGFGRTLPWLFVTALLAGCAHYVPLPLPSSARLAPTWSGLTSTVPLTVSAIVQRALADNPDLQAIRARHGVAQAQLLQAVLLPNPSIGGAFLPLLSGVGVGPAWNVALSADVKALVTYRSRRRGARSTARQVDAEILWQEWQVAGQARQLTVELIASERTRPMLRTAFDLLQRRNVVLQAALAAGNATLVTAAPTLVAVQNARAALYALDQRQLTLRHQLNALLALAPEAVVPLTTTPDLPPFDPATIRASLATLPTRRPDLLALRLGYAAADEGVRTAILSQFPDLILGPTVTSDSSRVINGGPQATIGLPIFNRNQGGVAIARATRIELKAQYAARLATAIGEVGALLAEMAQLTAQLDVVRRDLPAARLAATRAAAAFGASAIDERSFVDLVVNRFTKEQEIMTLEQALLTRQVAVQTLAGDGLPPVETLAAPVAER